MSFQMSSPPQKKTFCVFCLSFYLAVLQNHQYTEAGHDLPDDTVGNAPPGGGILSPFSGSAEWKSRCGEYARGLGLLRGWVGSVFFFWGKLCMGTCSCSSCHEFMSAKNEGEEG